MNEAYDYASEIPANTAYDAAFGCAHILADCQANDMALFESAIYSDFAEVRSLQEGVSVVNENAFTNVIKKIVEMFKKLLAKIKGIFAAFIAKLTGAFTDGKKLVKKYEKQIIKYGNWKGFKCKKIRKPSSGNDNIKNAIDKMFTEKGVVAGGNYAIKIKTDNSVELNTGVTGFETVEEINDGENSDIKGAILNNWITGVSGDYEDFSKNATEALYEDESEIDGEDDHVDGSFFSKAWIKTVLNDDKWVKDVKKFNEKIEKNINTIIDNLNKADDNLADAMRKNDGQKMATPSADDLSNKFNTVDSSTQKVQKVDKKYTLNSNSGVDPQDIQKAIHALQKLAGQDQEVITKVTSEYMAQVKFAIAQARKLWTAAAAWSSGVHKESVEYVEAVGECAAEQFYTNMESLG